MKQKIYTSLLAIAIIVTAQLSHAQAPNYLNQVVVLTQGYYDYTGDSVVIPATIGSYNPATKSYQNFDTLPQVRFANDVIIDSGYIYVAADSLLIKYDLNTKQKIATQVVQGIREIAIWGDEILATRGQYYALSSYFQAFDKNTLTHLYDVNVSYATEGIKVLNDTAYVAVNNFGTGDIGYIAVIDLKNQTENREINLGSTGYDPYDVEVEQTNNTVYTVNDLNYDSTSITKYTPLTGAYVTTVVNRSSPCNGSTYYFNNIYYQSGLDNNIQVFRTSQLSVWDSLPINKSIAGIGPDSVHGYLYIGNTDYRTFGKAFIYNLYGGVIDSFNTGVDPGNFAFDVRSNTGINPISSFAANLLIYPNPVADNLHLALLDSKDAQANITLFDILGQQVYRQLIPTNASEVVPMNSLSPGIYFLKTETNSGELTKKIVKE